MSTLMSQELGGTMAYRRGRARDASQPGVKKSQARVPLFFLALFAVSLFYVWSNAQVVRATYNLSRQRALEKEFMVHNEKLRLEIATLRSPTTLSKTALEQLKMVPPDPNRIVMVK